MRPISMAQNDLLHGPPQSVHDNHLHVFSLALTFVLRIEYGGLLFNSGFHVMPVVRGSLLHTSNIHQHLGKTISGTDYCS